MKNAQISLNYIMLIFILFLALTIMFAQFKEAYLSDIEIKQTQDFVDTIGRAVNLVGSMNEGSILKLRIIVPDSLQNISFRGKKIEARLSKPEINHFFMTEYNTTSNLTFHGKPVIFIEKLNNDLVEIKSVPSGILAIINRGPQGKRNNTNETIYSITNIASECKFDSEDEEFDEMENNFDGNLSSHTKNIQTISPGTYQYFVKCKYAQQIAEDKIEFEK